MTIHRQSRPIEKDFVAEEVEAEVAEAQAFEPAE